MFCRPLLTLLLLLTCATTYAAELDRIIAVVDDDVVMRSELDAMLSRVRGELRERGAQVPPSSVLERQVMERLILQKIQLQLAEQAGVEVTEENLDRAIQDIADKNNLTIPQFQNILANEGYEFERFREDIRQEILLSKLRREEVDRRIQVTDREIENELKIAGDGKQDDNEYHIAHILVSIPSSASDAERRRAEEKAQEVADRLAEGTDFGDVALAMSDAQDALDKGDLGWRKIDEIPSVFSATVRQLQVDQHSDMIRSPSGYHFVKLLGTRGGEQVLVEQTKVRHILITPNELVDEAAAIERLRQLRLRLESGDDFAAIARTHSDDRGSALQGGDLGWVSPGQMVPEFEEVMQATDKNQISAPFRSEYGWHLLQVLDRRSYDGTDEVRRAKAREAILSRKREEAYQEWQRRLRDEAYVELRLDE
ncbi:MAG: peptidylprolyl isomerase [Gammaproteobacteria bacterium]